MIKYIILLICASAASFVLTPLVKILAKKLGGMDFPDKRKIHSRPIARLGGISIFISFNLILLLSSGIKNFNFPDDFLKKTNFLWLFIASVFVFGIGVVDDLRKLPPSIKFLFQVTAGLIVALLCLRIEDIASPFGALRFGIFSIPVTVLWIVAITNAINLLDGLDGLAGGTSFIVCLAIFGISFLNQNIGVALTACILGGSILGFLRYNFHPASIFLGDSGAYFLGFTLSVLSIQGSLKGTTTIVILIPILALGLPILDTFVSMLRRLLKSLHVLGIEQGQNKVKLLFLGKWSIFKADRDHIHHKLLQTGFTQRKAVNFLYAVSIILSGMALALAYFKNLNSALFLTAIGLASFIGIKKLGYREIQVLSNGALLPLFDAPLVSGYLLRIFVDIALIALSFYTALILRFEGNFGRPIKKYYIATIGFILFIKTMTFFLSGLYRRSWRYMDVVDLMKIFQAVAFGCFLSALLLWVIPSLGIISYSVFFIDFVLLLFFVVVSRSSFRILEHWHSAKNDLGKKVLIYGVGKQGILILKEFINNSHLGLRPVGFIDDEPRNQGKLVNGYPVLGDLDALEEILEAHSISKVIISQGDFPSKKLEQLRKICEQKRTSLSQFKFRLEEI